jgi:hypothetical protein
VNGNQLVPLQETNISIAKEVLTIAIGDDGYASVDVQYVFQNNGEAKTVTMGFQANAPYNDQTKLNPAGRHPYISDFVTVLNGNQLAYRNAVVAENDFEPLDLKRWKTTEGLDFEQSDNLYDASCDSIVHFAYAYYFTAHFKPGRNEVHHTYRYRMSYGVARTFEIPYWLTPAMRWANRQIDDFTLRIKAENTAKHFVMADSLLQKATFRIIGDKGKVRHDVRLLDVPVVEIALRNAVAEWHQENFKPVDDLLIQAADLLYAFDAKAPLGSYYDRNEHYVPNWKNMTEDVSPWEKRILRNLPYAHRGYVFRDKQLQRYFSQLWWYMPDSTWVMSADDFTPHEQELIKTYK